MTDTAVAACIAGEEERQRDGLELIPSENYVSQDVRKSAKTFAKRLAAFLLTNILKVTLGSAITAAKNSPIASSN